jgi:hypothetical protein
MRDEDRAGDGRTPEGAYQNGGYWATALGWFLDTLMRADPALAAKTFLDAVDDFRATGDINEWIAPTGARGATQYKASAALPLAGVRRLRAHLARTDSALPEALDRRLREGADWLAAEAKRVIRGCARPAADGTTLFTPDVDGNYRAFWVRDWSYAIEGCPETFSADELHGGFCFLVRAQRGDGCMPDRVRADGTPIYSPGPEGEPWSEHGSVDQSPFMVLLCDQCCTLLEDDSLFTEHAERLERGMRFTPRDPQSGLVVIEDPAAFRPYSFLDSIPLTGAVSFSSLLWLEAAARMAQRFAALGRREKATAWREEAERVRGGLDRLWDEAEGCFVAASERWAQPSVWSSLYAVYAGLASEAQTRRIVEFCLREYDRIVLRGQIRHLPAGSFWGAPAEEG